jgi:hypothetical protein
MINDWEPDERIISDCLKLYDGIAFDPTILLINPLAKLHLV